MWKNVWAFSLKGLKMYLECIKGISVVSTKRLMILKSGLSVSACICPQTGDSFKIFCPAVI